MTLIFRAFRWASDRIGDEGIVAYVSNGGWLDGNGHGWVSPLSGRRVQHHLLFQLAGECSAHAGELSAQGRRQ